MENFIPANALRDWFEPNLERRYQLESRTLVQEEPSPEILATHLAACKPDDRADCQTKIEPGSSIWCRHAKSLPLQERAFRHANLHDAVLCGATLHATKLQGANLTEAKLQGATLSWAELQGADLTRAKLQDADLTGAKLQGADLTEAKLQGADLIRAKLQGADLNRAELQDANLNRAELQGADLNWAKLRGAYLNWAKLQGADLSEAELQNANLTGAKLQGANLNRAELQGANLSEAELQGANLIRAKLQGADLTRAKLQGADLRKAYLAGSDLSNANLNLTDLRGVDLERKSGQKQLQKEKEEEATIAPSSIEDAIFSEGSALYKQLQEPENRELLQTDHFTQTKEEDYDTKLAAYLIDSLSCEYEDNYVAEGIIRYRIPGDKVIILYSIFEIFGNESRKLASIFAKKLNLDSKFVKKLNRGSKVPILLCPDVEKHLHRLSERERIQLREIVAESANQ